MEEGAWNVYFKSSIGVDNLSQYGFRSIRFASKDVWNPTLGANYLGFVKVAPSDAKKADNTIGEVGNKLNDAHLYSFGGKVVVDGAVGDGEWTEQDVIAEKEGYKMYAKADEENLYIMADIPHNAKAPVFNFSAKTADGKSYWLYQQSNGAVYFNHKGETGHAGLLMKYSDKLFEFKIPFYMLDIRQGTEFKEISVNIQDSSIKGWKSTGSIKTDKSYSVSPQFTIFNAYEKLTIKSGGDYEIRLFADADIADIVWYLDGNQIENEKSAYLKLENIINDCLLSAKVTSANGSVREINIAEIKVL